MLAGCGMFAPDWHANRVRLPAARSSERTNKMGDLCGLPGWGRPAPARGLCDSVPLWLGSLRLPVAHGGPGRRRPCARRMPMMP